jgi:hypothetical protein
MSSDWNSQLRYLCSKKGYINPGKTTLEFDCQLLYTPTNTENTFVRFQNNVSYFIEC